MRQMDMRILVIEPRMIHSMWMKPALDTAGLKNVTIEADPLLGLHIYLSGKFDLVLASYPCKIEGCEWILAAKSMLRNGNAPVVAMLASAEHTDHRAARSQKADDTILKPFTSRSVTALVQKHIGLAYPLGNVIDLEAYRLIRESSSLGGTELLRRSLDRFQID